MCKISNDSFKVPYYTNELMAKGVSKIEFLRLLISIQEGERSKIGHELHDSVNALLAVAKLYLDLIRTSTPEDKCAKQQVCYVISSAIEAVRNISRGLAVSERTDISIVQLIQELTTVINGAGRFKVLFTHCSEIRFSKLCPGRKLSLFRIVQEQVNNIIKHSKAKNVCIRLGCKGDGIILIIEDDGIGFDPMQSAKGIGIVNMRSRLKEFDGNLEIKSEPNKGCALFVTIPGRV